MGIKDKLEAILSTHPDMTGGDAEHLSDAIIAALPSMIPDLEWEVRRSAHWSRGGAHKYVYWKQDSGSWYAVGADGSVLELKEQDCIDWANAHNRTTIMKAFGVQS